MTAAHDELLERCADFLQHNGFEPSLRQIAAGVGTSHRMLIYHFGSRSGLLTEVVLRTEAQQRELLAQLSVATDDMVEVSTEFWLQLTDPALAPSIRMFFEICSDALHDRPWTTSFRESVVSDWEGPLAAGFRQRGLDEAQAKRWSRLGLAVVRGLLLDRMLTGDLEATDGAVQLFAELLPSTSGT